MANRTPDQLLADNAIDPTAGQTTVPAMQSSTLGAFDMQAVLAAKASATHAATHAAGGSDALSGCGLACSYTPTQWTPSAATIEGQFTGLNTKIALLQPKDGGGNVAVTGTLDSAGNFSVGTTQLTVNATSGNLVSAGTVAAAAGSVSSAGLSVGSVATGLYRPATSQLGLAANSKAVIVDNDGATPSLRGDATATWDLGEAGITWRRGYIATLVAPAVADSADPTKTATFVLSGITTGTNRTITMPDADVDLTYVQQASVTARGTAELADATEAKALADTSRVITPATLGAVLADTAALGATPIRHVRIIANPHHNDVTLASELEDGDTFEGETLATGDLVVLTNQSTGGQNGPWVVAASGAPARPAWFAAGAGAAGAAFVALDGYAAGRVARVTNDRDADTIDTHDLTVRFDTKVHRGSTPTSSDGASTGCFPGDLWIVENVDDSHVYLNAGEDAASPVWRRLDTDALQESATLSAKTLDAEDANKIYYYSDGTEVVLTINTGLPDMVVTFVQDGAGAIKANAGTATRRGSADFDQGSSVFHTASQYSEMTVKIRGGVAYISGDLALAP